MQRRCAVLTFGATTRELVSHFQREQSLQANGEVDEATANVLNALSPIDLGQEPRSHIASGAEKIKGEGGQP